MKIKIISKHAVEKHISATYTQLLAIVDFISWQLLVAFEIQTQKLSHVVLGLNLIK